MTRASDDHGRGVACGKIILSGEHAVVYGKHALAIPIKLAVSSHVRRRADARTYVGIAGWGVAPGTPVEEAPEPVRLCLEVICRQLGLHRAGFELSISPQIARGSGLGGSAAMAVATIRAFMAAFDLALGAAEVSALGFECEKIAHGTPSGVDNTVATYAHPLLFRKSPPLMKPLALGAPMQMVVGLTGEPGMTVTMVQRVRAMREAAPQKVDDILDAMDRVTLCITEALQQGRIPEVGGWMSENHRLLRRLGVSSPSLDRLVDMALASGALGAKLTGGGGGGAMIALCQHNAEAVAAGMRQQGFSATALEIA